MFKSYTERAVKSVVDSVPFEKVSDLTKEQFTQILTDSIYAAINDRNYFDEIYEQIDRHLQRDMRARGYR